MSLHIGIYLSALSLSLMTLGNMVNYDRVNINRQNTAITRYFSRHQLPESNILLHYNQKLHGETTLYDNYNSRSLRFHSRCTIRAKWLIVSVANTHIINLTINNHHLAILAVILMLLLVTKL